MLHDPGYCQPPQQDAVQSTKKSSIEGHSPGISGNDDARVQLFTTKTSMYRVFQKKTTYNFDAP